MEPWGAYTFKSGTSTFKNGTFVEPCGTSIFKSGTFMWNLVEPELFKSGTLFMWNLVEPELLTVVEPEH